MANSFANSGPSTGTTAVNPSASGNPNMGGAVNQSASQVPTAWAATRGVGMTFDDGGAVPDTSSAMGQGDALTQQINKALSTVDSVLDYGRQLHGLGGGDNTDSGGIQEANAGYQNGRMPAVPGSQSNSGVPPIQPQPGPLPPTSNPFGKRADASDGAAASAPTDQDSSGGVQTDDDDQESA